MKPVAATTPVAELHPSRLLRAAAPQRHIEAAIVLLCQSGVLGRLHSCITVDLDRDVAWMDWEAAEQMAERLAASDRAVVLMACTLAQHGGFLRDDHPDTWRLAIHHLGADRAPERGPGVGVLP